MPGNITSPAQVAQVVYYHVCTCILVPVAFDSRDTLPAQFPSNHWCGSPLALVHSGIDRYV